MPAIGHENNIIKVKLSCECKESHDEFDDTDDDPIIKDPQSISLDDLPLSIILQHHKTGCWMISFTSFCILTIWFALTYWVIVSPSTGYCRAYCNELIYSSGSISDFGEKAFYKLEKHFEKFNELSSLYGRYYNISDKKINSALQDAYLWFIIYRLIGNDDLTEQDKMFIRENYFGIEGVYKYNALRMTTMRISAFLPKSVNTMLGLKQTYEAKISSYGIREYYSEKKRLENQNKEVILLSSRLGQDNKYLLYDKIAYGGKYATISKTNQVTLTTQSSLDRLPSFLHSASNWTGPISLAVFVNETNEYCSYKKYLHYLKRCQPNIYDRTCFSLATPNDVNLTDRKSSTSCHLDTTSCASADNAIANELKKPANTSKQPPQGPGYPQNTMRNLAKYNILTSYHLMLDIDIIPSPKMSSSLNKFLKGKPVYKNGLVIPTYEISKKAKFPANKAELVNLRRKGQAQPFHKDVFPLNQNATEFTKWEKIHDTFDDVKIVYDVTKFHLCYEPFFVEHHSGPFYNESFIGYGFTRSSHAYETYTKNGNFQVLSPVFTVQLGLQKVKEWSPERQKQNNYNHFLFQQFVANLQNRTFAPSFIPLG